MRRKRPYLKPSAPETRALVTRADLLKRGHAAGVVNDFTTQLASADDERRRNMVMNLLEVTADDAEAWLRRLGYLFAEPGVSS